MSTVTMTKSAGMRSQGWRATFAIICESCKSVPQLTAGGWIPSPMKLRTCLADNHAGNGKRDRNNDIAREKRQQMFCNDPPFAHTGNSGGDREILFT